MIFYCKIIRQGGGRGIGGGLPLTDPIMTPDIMQKLNSYTQFCCFILYSLLQQMHHLKANFQRTKVHKDSGRAVRLRFHPGEDL